MQPNSTLSVTSRPISKERSSKAGRSIGEALIGCAPAAESTYAPSAMAGWTAPTAPGLRLPAFPRARFQRPSRFGLPYPSVGPLPFPDQRDPGR